MKSCLVVDDSRIVRLLARRILEDLSFEVLEAADGEDALEICRDGMPTAILLDWNMPVMDGMQFLQHLRDMPGGAEPKVILCTTENGMPKIMDAISAGADEYIMKPFDTQIIESKFSLVELI
jgi:two-component system chemotaxis response regulator CheY